ncbi:MAG: hypothetical protein COV31_01260 [Candidatus Yanofskybacteria bacterium CG10_big_fil_rev_8_21_14_0_10_46_23]|uniref:Uncharacterized protein n=1 Tax=Candidatus Yanofskybacteria bacterium CG10_big_fil_rev_8_21_14_0_10_46_23 TaxID=1975098 RepID=A0A2H0R4M7_9BACT|nr:MAG: hypothetical protein COV31_01260 [Candidatus Yanofskybacteria bacterium CG10_big_fil_rev_8_21_14_0_10_46_23]
MKIEFSKKLWDLPKKIRQKIRKEERLEAIQRLKRIRKFQKIFFWLISTIIAGGTLIALLAAFGYYH